MEWLIQTFRTFLTPWRWPTFRKRSVFTFNILVLQNRNYFLKTQSENYRQCAICFSIFVPLKSRINTDGYTWNVYDLFYLVKYLFDQTVGWLHRKTIYERAYLRKTIYVRAYLRWSPVTVLEDVNKHVVSTFRLLVPTSKKVKKVRLWPRSRNITGSSRLKTKNKPLKIR